VEGEERDAVNCAREWIDLGRGVTQYCELTACELECATSIRRECIPSSDLEYKWSCSQSLDITLVCNICKEYKSALNLAASNTTDQSFLDIIEKLE
jgi:hypothetical protein